MLNFLAIAFASVLVAIVLLAPIAASWRGRHHDHLIPTAARSPFARA